MRQCSETLAANGWLRWHPMFECGAILCEELCADHMALAGGCRRQACAGHGWRLTLFGCCCER